MKPDGGASPGSWVIVVDDDESIRESLLGLLRSAGFEVMAFASADQFLELRLPPAPCCLLLDVRLPGRSGLDLQKELLTAVRQIPIIFLTGHADIPMTVRAMKSGALEFLTKPFGDEELLQVIRQALARDRATLEKRAQDAALQERFGSLTPREREVMELVVQGLLNKQVAGRLGTSEVTVKIQRGNVMRKLGARSLADLVRMVGKQSDTG
jgi:FixJ family two-component response regulator